MLKIYDSEGRCYNENEIAAIREELERRKDGQRSVILHEDDIPAIRAMIQGAYDSRHELKDNLQRIEFMMFCGRVLHALEDPK